MIGDSDDDVVIPRAWPEWRPGHELTFWPDLKLARAQQHIADLHMRLLVWSRSTTVKRRVSISEDQRRVDVFVDMLAPAPIAELALSLGDAVHNMRSSLDAVVWELAHLDGRTPRSPRRVAFPICEREADWSSAVSTLETVPSVALERIRSLQPFVQTEPHRSALHVLHQLDIRDKHRTSLECALEVQNINLDDAVIEFVDPDAIPDPPLSLDIADPLVLADGTRVLSLHSTAKIRRARVPVGLRGTVQVESANGREPVDQLLQALLVQVQGSLHLIYHGEEGMAENARMMQQQMDGHPPANLPENWQPTDEWDATVGDMS